MLTWALAPSVELVPVGATRRWAAVSDAAEERLALLRRPVDRRDFVAARLAAASCVADLTGATASTVEFTQRCARCSGSHGPPEIVGRPDLAVSWSHSNGWVAAVACNRRSESTAVGIDVEVPTGRREIVWDALDADQTDVVARAADPWTTFLALWVRKEAVIKARHLDLDHLRDVDTRSTAASMVVGAAGPLAGSAVAFAALRQPHRQLALPSVIGRRREH